MIIYNGGDKGGTGKSMMSILCTHYFIEYYKSHGRLPEDRPILFDTDRTNPNVFEIYNKCAADIDCQKIDLSASEGWEGLVDLHDAFGDRPVIINSGSTDIVRIADMRQMLTEVQDLIVFWVINTEADSMILLDKFMNVVERQPVVVIKNLFFGEANVFRNFEDSKFRKEGVKAVCLPVASPSLINILYTDRIPLHEITNAPKERISLGKKAATKLWAKKASMVVPEAIAGALGNDHKFAQKYNEGFKFEELRKEREMEFAGNE